MIVDCQCCAGFTVPPHTHVPSSHRASEGQSGQPPGHIQTQHSKVQSDDQQRGGSKNFV